MTAFDTDDCPQSSPASTPSGGAGCGGSSASPDLDRQLAEIREITVTLVTGGYDDTDRGEPWTDFGIVCGYAERFGARVHALEAVAEAAREADGLLAGMWSYDETGRESMAHTWPVKASIVLRSALAVLGGDRPHE